MKADLRKERNYNEKEIDFNNILNKKIYVLMPVHELTWILGGCEKEINAIRVNEYPLIDQNPCDPKAKTINGIFCHEAFNGKDPVDELCEGCKFYGEKHEAPIYEYKGEVQKQKSKKRQ
jgi:thymidylate synthase